MNANNRSNRAVESKPLMRKTGLRLPRQLRKLTYAGGLSLFVFLLAGAVAVAGTVSYTIQYGDTLSELAERHETSVESLAELNNIADPDLIVTGDELLLPTGDSETDVDVTEDDQPVNDSADGTSYVIQDGDTLTSIASAFGVTVEDLVAWNDIANPEIIVVDDVLVIPAADYAIDEITEDLPDSDDQTDGITDTDGQTTDASDPVDDAGADLVLHLVLDGETLDSIAEQYGISIAQLTSANHHASDGVSSGMILKIPPAGLDGARITGMPTHAEQWPLVSELSATSLATTYWGATVEIEELLAQLSESDNPHAGFRGNPQGMFGLTEDYGVYNEPLVEALEAFGYDATAFYSDGDTDGLISWIESGVPVVVWVTYGLEPQERIVVETDSGTYSLIPEQHALLVYGYDADGIEVVDVSDGTYKHLDWDAFVSSWLNFDGMSLAIAPF